jgi:hypothetical protein
VNFLVKGLRKIPIEKRKESITEKGRIKKIVLLGYGRTTFRVSANTLGTTRKFKSLNQLKNYLKLDQVIRKALNLSTLLRFNAKTPQIIIVDKKGLQVVERVYPCVNVLNILSPSTKLDSRYLKFYQRMLKKNKITEKNAQEIVEKAYNELVVFFTITKIPYDHALSNVLVENIDPKTKVVDFILVDHGGSIRE